jgi:class 3 adenylate cyclase/CHAT domain-containing protein
MGEGKDKKAGPEPGKMEQILRERDRIDKLIQERFRKKKTILFSDVCGYTQYMDTWGDIAGRAWIQKHHDIVLPVIKDHEGEVLDIMGDGVMASFATSLTAVRASMAIQEGLSAYNAKVEKAQAIHVKIGVNTGEILVDEGQIAGDVVNVASRIQNQAGPDQILIDKSVYREVCGCEDILCRFHGAIRVKGKSAALDLYKVLWQDEDIVLSAEPKLRAPEPGAEKGALSPLRVLNLEISLEKDRLKISAGETSGREVSTVRHYEEIPISRNRIGGLCTEVVETLNSVNRKGRLTRDVLTKLREVGQLFRDELFTPDVKEKIRETKADHLVLNLDDQLVHIPWELIHDGHDFLCQRFNMGRLVRTRQPVLGTRVRSLGRPFKMLVLVDPKGDLGGAYQEGTQIRDFMDKHKEFVSVSFRSADITKDFIRQKIRNFDLIHFAGHAEYNPEDPGESGWRLTDGTLTAKDIMKMAGTAAMPALVFSNACQSARTEEWRIKERFQDEIFGLANAFILAGVKHYIGTFWEILDEPSSRFSLECYKKALSGMTVGEAVRQARLALIKEYGEDTIVWASYLLYGDPTFNYMEMVLAAEADSPSKPVSMPSLDGVPRTREQVIDFGKEEIVKKKKVWSGLAVGIAALILFVFFGYPGLFKTDTDKIEQEILGYYHTGQYDKALAVSKTLAEKNPKLSLPFLIEGNVSLRRGKIDAAEHAFQGALEAATGTAFQRAEAMIGLGRIASLRKEQDKALEYYQKATEAAPGSRSGYLSQALFLEDKGDYREALSLLEKARAMEPEDPTVTGMADEIRKKAIYLEDQEKQARIDGLVKELLESMKSPPRALPWDGWTSSPLTVWILDFQTQGYSLQEGEERLLAAGISEELLQGSRVQLVERQLLEKLLEELKLGTSNLADQSTALSLGRLLAAKLILRGQVVYSGPQTQVSMRIIETETGRISAAVNETFGSAVPLSTVAAKLSGILVDKLVKLYPLRGKISENGNEQVTLNIGEAAGVAAGQTFKAVDEDLTFEVVSVRPHTCAMKIVKGDVKPVMDMHVEAVKP